MDEGQRHNERRSVEAGTNRCMYAILILFYFGMMQAEALRKFQDATYLLKCVQGFTSKGFRPYAISAQNEPLNTNPTYPTSKLTAAQEAQIGLKLRSLLNSNGFSSTKIIGEQLGPSLRVACGGSLLHSILWLPFHRASFYVRKWKFHWVADPFLVRVICI